MVLARLIALSCRGEYCHGKILGGARLGTHVGDMIDEMALAIEMGADAVEATGAQVANRSKPQNKARTLAGPGFLLSERSRGKGERGPGMAVEVAHGSCTPICRRRKNCQ